MLLVVGKGISLDGSDRGNRSHTPEPVVELPDRNLRHRGDLAIRIAIGEALNGFPFLTFLISSFLCGPEPGIVVACLTGFIVLRFFLPPFSSFLLIGANQWLGFGSHQRQEMVGVMQIVLNSHRKQAELRSQLVDFNRLLECMVEERTAALKKEIAEREASQAQVHQLKMESIGHLTGGVAHDFNDMLAIIIGGIDLVERRLVGTEDPKLIRSLKNARRATGGGSERAAPGIFSPPAPGSGDDRCQQVCRWGVRAPASVAGREHPDRDRACSRPVVDICRSEPA